MFDLNLPDITDNTFKSEKEVKQVKDYLYQLTEQMRYSMNHIDEENLTEDFKSTVLKGANGEVAMLELTVEGLTASVESAAGRIATLQLTADGLSTRVSNAEGEISTLELTTQGLALAVANSKLTFDANGLTIKNGGFKIVNQSGTAVCSADANGNLTMVGNGTFDTAKFCNELLSITYQTDTGCTLNSSGNIFVVAATNLGLQADIVTILPKYSGGNFVAFEARRQNSQWETTIAGDTVFLSGKIIVNGRDITQALANL